MRSCSTVIAVTAALTASGEAARSYPFAKKVKDFAAHSSPIVERIAGLPSPTVPR